MEPVGVGTISGNTTVRIPQISSGNSALSDSDESYYVEVLEHVDHPINVQATVHEVPKEPSTPKPVFKSHKESEKLPIQLSSNQRMSDTACHGSLKLDTDQESPYCDNPCCFPDVETDDCANFLFACSEQLILRPLC